MESYKRYMILYESGGLAEFVGFYEGANGASVPIYKLDNLYYVLQNPTTGSIFGTFARRGFTIYWEVREYPKFGELKYTGRLIHSFKLTTKGEAYDFFSAILKQERILMREKHVSV